MPDPRNARVLLRRDSQDALSPVDLVTRLRTAAPGIPIPVAAELATILAAAGPDDPLSDRLDALVSLAAWLRVQTPLVLPDRANVGGGSVAARLWVLVEALREAPEWRAALAGLVTGVLLETSTLRLFAHTGLPIELRFFAEFANRLARRVLPRPPDEACLAALVARVFPDEGATQWLDAAPPGLVVELATLLVFVPGEPTARYRMGAEAAEALTLVVVRAASVGLDEDIRSRSELSDVGVAPVLALARTCAAYLEARRRAEAGHPAGKVEARRLRAEAVWHVAAARIVLDGVVDHLDEGGVSVDLVFRVELLGRLLERADHLLALLDTDPPDPALQRARAVRFIRDLVAQDLGDRSFVALVQRNSRLLARRIIERAGETGEHYITTSRAEWHRMVESAAGGGYLTAGTVAVKFALGYAALPYFFQGLLSGLNYALCFVGLQALGFTLATKQPSMTAASLAANIDASEGGLEPLVELIARTLRSQLAAFIGNLGMVVPVAVGVNIFHEAFTGRPFLDAGTAEHVIAMHHPWQSGTLLYAMLTGVLLWASSIVGGWLENWSALHRLPEAIAEHPSLGRRLGRPRMQGLARTYLRNVSAFGTNVSLGLLLGAAPIVGKFFGLPLDVRHVTFSTGALTLAGASVGPLAIVEPAFRYAVLGICGVGTLNFAVSFSLALAVALRARNIPFVALLALVRAVAARFARRPWSFVFPPV
ncbi:MAG: gliding motility protein [Pseudomonadota bacterium]|nr:gliding motility protein [Pseudomonadota bacterium]